MKLVIVESPTKARTISKFLGNGYEIRASMGHVMDLPKSKLGIDIEHDFAPEFEISEGKSAIIKELQRLAAKAEMIILATDPDREGEAIASNIQELLGEKGIPFARIVFHEITKEAIENALHNPGVVNKHLVDAQIARRILDRLVGYKISPLLWQKVRRGLSAGRVQSVALRLIVQREREIEKFKKENYWTVNVILVSEEQAHPGTLNHKTLNNRDSGLARMTDNQAETEFDLVEINGQKIDLSEKKTLYDGDYTFGKTTIDTQEKADIIIKDLPTKKFFVSDVISKKTKRSPQPAFTTSTLQQQAAGRFGFSGKRTMSLAQKLYEEGYITYHRTDSVNLALKAILQMRDYIKKVFGEKFIPEKPRFYTSRQKLAQEAHEAIRPTKVQTRMQDIVIRLGATYAKLYDLIWKRAVASQMSDALVESTTVLVDTSSQLATQNSQTEQNNSNINHQKTNKFSNVYLFKTTGSVLVFEGFLKVNPFGLTDKKLPNFTAADKLNLVQAITEKHQTTPPPRYNDASVIKSLEEAGIGRPSTYAAIIFTIEARNYIERDQGRFVPTSVGLAVNDFLVKNFSDIDDIPFTAGMEDELDSIASDHGAWVPMIKKFYNPFEKQLEVVKKADRVQIATEETGELCPKDNAPLVIRVGRFGKFISCKNFPACDFKKAILVETKFTCSKDGGKIIVRKTKKSRTFYSCANYPKCDFAVWKISDLKKSANDVAK